MKRRSLNRQALQGLLAAAMAAALIGCGSNDAPGWDAESKAAAEALDKAGNDLSKITPEQRAALERAAGGAGSNRGMQSTSTGGAAPTNGAGAATNTGATNTGATNGAR